MKFNRKDLIKRAQDEIDRRQEQFEKNLAKWEEEKEGSAEKWEAQYRDSWAKVVTNIQHCLDNHENVTPDVFPIEVRTGNSYTPFRFYSEQTMYSTHNRPKAPDSADLERLIRILNTILDDEVSTTALDQIGFKNVVKLF